MGSRAWAIAEFHRLRAIETDDCVEWPYGTNRAGYGQLNINGTTARCHRLALIYASCGVAPDEMQAAHGPCNNRRCMNVRHLSWKTHAENMADMLRDGTQPRGHRSPHAKLTEDDVLFILESDEPQKDLGARYGVSESLISHIKCGRRWKHLTEGIAA